MSRLGFEKGRVMENSIKKALLIVINSPRQAFYMIWINKGDQFFRVCKASGAQGRVLHRQAWEFESLEEAEVLFVKTSPG